MLIPVVDRPEPQVLLTLRTELPSHPGQIAFPGGKIDRRRSPRRLRRLCAKPQEEIGLEPGSDRADRLSRPLSHLLRLSHPADGRARRPDYRLVLCEAEVADAFEVPLAFLMDAQNHALHSRDWKGVTRRYYAMPFGERYIWGVTAGILRNLYERIYAEDVSLRLQRGPRLNAVQD